MRNILLSSSLALCICGLLVPLQSEAMEAPAPVADEAALLSAFRTILVPTMPDLAVPTVVDVPLAVEYQTPQFIVQEIETGQYIGHYYKKTYARTPVAITAYTESGETLSALTDAKYDTAARFAVTGEDEQTTTIVLRSAVPLTADSIVLNLMKNVALPSSVSLRTGESSEEVVIAPRSLKGTVIPFPKTTAKRWYLTLTHAQPLLLSEVKLVQSGLTAEEQQSVRFLAQPNKTYRVYANPDRSVRVQRSETGNLHDNAEILPVPAVMELENETYVLADVDGDGVPDLYDNCTVVKNSKQIDINGNNRGDACDDFDRDSILNYVDNCPNNPNRSQADEDGDGLGDVCDDAESRLTEQYQWIPWVGMAAAAALIGGMFLMLLRRPEETTVTDEPLEDDGIDSDE